MGVARAAIFSSLWARLRRAAAPNKRLFTGHVPKSELATLRAWLRTRMARRQKQPSSAQRAVELGARKRKRGWGKGSDHLLPQKSFGGSCFPGSGNENGEEAICASGKQKSRERGNENAQNAKLLALYSY